MLRLLFAAAARRVLANTHHRGATAQIWQRTRALHRAATRHEVRRDVTPLGRRVGATAKAPGLGVRLLLRVLAWDHALFLALREAGDDAVNAGGIVEQVNWALARPGIRLADRIAALAGGGRLARVRRVVDALFAGLFGAPFERTVRDVPDAVAFDVTRCPLAEYFAARGTPELTRHAACALDHRMAAEWGVTLLRTRTLAEGGHSCDFCFVPLRRACGNGRRPK